MKPMMIRGTQKLMREPRSSLRVSTTCITLTAVGKAGGPEAQYDARRDPDQQAEGQALKDTVHR